MSEIQSTYSNGLAHRYCSNVKSSLMFLKGQTETHIIHTLSVTLATKSQKVKFNSEWTKQTVRNYVWTAPKYSE